MSFTVRSLDDIVPRPYLDWDADWLPVRHEIGAAALGLNAWRARAAGQPLVERHDESSLQHEEVYVVLRGRATFTAAGESIDAPAGTFVRVDPGTTREAVAEEARTVVLALGAPLGAAFSPSAWEQRRLREHPPAA